MDILTRGVERFEVIEVNEERSFLQAEISVVQDQDEDEPDKSAAQIVTQAVRLHAEIAKLAGTELSGAGRACQQSFIFTRRIASARPRLQAEPALDVVGKENVWRQWSAIWKRFCRVCGGQRRRVGTRLV